MSKIEGFEDLQIGKDVRIICQKIHETSTQTEVKNDFDLKNQLRNSSGSVMDNIAEGFERGGNMEFIQFPGFAKGSAGETRSQFYQLLDSIYISESKFEEV
jgi:four helix bundle protein